MNLKEKILAANDFERVEVPMPEWGCSVWLESLSTEKVLAFDKQTDNKNVFTEVLLSCRDEEGNQIFEKEECDAVLKKSYKAMKILLDEFNKLNGFTMTVEDLKKN